VVTLIRCLMEDKIDCHLELIIWQIN